MNTPSLVPAADAFPLPATFPVGTRVFDVRRDGAFAERVFRTGERLLVDGAGSVGDPVVLVARGPGRPRLGFVARDGLVGDRGEPCLASRWEVAGRVIGVARPLANGWSVERFDAPDLLGMVATPQAAVAQVPVVQLSLFAA
ncbi:MAG: hypothetical protein KC656_19035 [Myxococcales bacterium]|nr:hypothetical protein [Myxococcales bacterium]MCB9668471.1 hypothetical protein [Alphaproteobacteria bacterium]MCB9690709.1 hypothetical protein [Alphaproteobacteria bacterium]